MKQALVDKAARRAEREIELGARIRALPDQRFGCILADPEWRFEPYSRVTGMDRSADNHYPTSPLAAILARDVPSIAARDSCLFLWAIASMLPEALRVMEAWGFRYKSQMIWAKGVMGTGYWFRFKHEILLVGTKGRFVAPAMGTQWPSILFAPRQAHSQKPEGVARMIEELWPSIPKIELNRRGPPRPDWVAWGNEARP